MDRLGSFATGIKGRVTRGTARVPSSMDFQDISDPTGTHTLHSTGARHPSRDRQQQQRSSSGQPSTGTFLQATSQRFTGLFTGQPSHAHNATSPALPPQPPLVNQVFPKPLNLRRNRTEIYRLQGLMKRNNASTYSTSSSLAEEDEFNASFSRVQIKPPENQTKIQALRHWLINEGARRIFFAVWVLVHALVFALGFVHYSLKDNLNTARSTFGFTFAVARASALVLHVDVAFLLLPVCRNFITLIRRTHLNSFIPFDANITFHKTIGWSIFFFSTLHTVAHMRNFALFAQATKTGFVGFLQANFATGPGITGWIMTVILLVMIWYAMEKRRRKNFERFWYSHHLFIIFFALWQFHGMFCMIKPDRPPYCDYWQIGVFWKYFIFAGVIFVYERILREIRARHRTYISKVIQHPGDVVEVQIKKEKTTTRAGQYIFINCPDISYWQWHPFTLTSAPEEDFISVNIKMVGDWTKAFGTALRCEPAKKSKSVGDRTAGGNGPMTVASATGKENELLPDAPIKRVLPRIMVDGPFGSASEDYHTFEVVMLCAAGIGVTPFASILKSIWYRLNRPQPTDRKTRLSKVYFIHICRDTESVSWFRSLLAAIEAQDTNNSIEIMTYVTQKMKEDDLTNIMVADVGSEKDAVSGLRAPTHFGRPNWDTIFSNVRDKHPNTEVGTLFCGPKALGSTLHKMCNKWSSGDEDGTRFIYGKENF